MDRAWLLSDDLARVMVELDRQVALLARERRWLDAADAEALREEVAQVRFALLRQARADQ